MRTRTYGQLTQLTFLPNFFPVNCYLVEEESDLTLIDAALPYSAAAIREAARKIGKPIARIILTHAHGDHIGALDRLKEALPEAQIMISRRDAKLLAGDREPEPGEPAAPLKGDVPKPGAVRTKPDRLLEDGDMIGSLRAIAAPGHTPGMMAFQDVRSGAMVVGDAMQTFGGVAVSGKVKPLFPFPAFATWSKEMSLDSARRLREFAPSLIAPGHGNVIVQPLNVMDRAIEEAAQSLRKGGRHGI
ncbi:MBL fold metallo-hydrolase [Paenibacillus hamazuiensis]|uniref:MBL fold metallo-hydrolase n=1 Tax=Paenibacillus hamazuiensis TaxID=2936508 RepID=UPI00200E9E61|nr:MBL fold metallo-hydrolase [Paenibacillus hamazuiensis]